MSDNLMDDPQIELAAESFDTDAANLSDGDDVEAVVAEDDAAEDLAD